MGDLESVAQDPQRGSTPQAEIITNWLVDDIIGVAVDSFSRIDDETVTALVAIVPTIACQSVGAFRSFHGNDI